MSDVQYHFLNIRFVFLMASPYPLKEDEEAEGMEFLSKCFGMLICLGKLWPEMESVCRPFTGCGIKCLSVRVYCLSNYRVHSTIQLLLILHYVCMLV